MRQQGLHDVHTAQIAASLDASLARPAVPERARHSLPRTRAEISAYVRAVHDPFGALEVQ